MWELSPHVGNSGEWSCTFQFFFGTIPIGEHTKFGKGGCLKDPSILPHSCSLSILLSSNCGNWCADFKLGCTWPVLGPLYLRLKPNVKPLTMCVTSCLLGWPCSCYSNHAGLTGFIMGWCCSGCSIDSCRSASALYGWVTSSVTFVAFVWEFTADSGALAFVVVETDTKIRFSRFIPGHATPWTTVGYQSGSRESKD